jgi:hypothetical protein
MMTCDFRPTDKTKPPVKPPCQGLFELMTAGPSREALAVCRPCPIKTWCYETVSPRAGGFTGVCGGAAWVNGRQLKGNALKELFQ